MNIAYLANGAGRALVDHDIAVGAIPVSGR